MKRTSRTLMMAAAMTGLISGAAMQQGCSDTNNANNTAPAPAPGKVADVKKAPTAHGCSGQNDCKGIGGCKTDAHACKFTNSCKGKGGCEITEKDISAWQKKQTASQ
jgi:hypothetical protein